MARALNRLAARTIMGLTERGRHADGGGLYLQIDGRENKQWVFLYRRDGKRREMGLGPLNSVSLANARARAAKCRLELASGIDPMTARREEAEQARAEREVGAATESRTFGVVAEAMLKDREQGWKNDKHRAQWRSTLKTYAASLWDRDVSAISTEHVLGALQPIWAEIPETASRVRGRIEAVLNAARARGFIPEDRANPARWRGHLDHLLPKRKRLSRGHHAALPWRQLPEFVSRLRERDAPAAATLEFIILTVARSGEARGMNWREIDLAAKVWTVPADRMKAGREHRVPLSERAVAILTARSPGKPGELVFPNANGGRPMSDMAFKALYDRMGIAGITTHGFRSSFRDWAGDATNFPHEIIETALAHTIQNKAEAAYRRSDALERRRALMEQWATFCKPRPDAKIVALIRK